MTTLPWIVCAALAGGVLATLAAAATLRVNAAWIPPLVSFAVGALRSGYGGDLVSAAGEAALAVAVAARKRSVPCP